MTAIGFVSVSVLPFAAYSPNPPAVGHPDTIGTRTERHFIMVAISNITAVRAVLVGRKLTRPTVLDPKWFAETASVIVRLFSEAHIALAQIKARRRL